MLSAEQGAGGLSDAPQADGRWLYGYWYPALRSDVAAGHGHGARHCSSACPCSSGATPTARPSPCATAARTAGIPLSYGRFDGREVECAYHGWRFEPRSGQCRAIPSLPAGLAAARRPHLRHGLPLPRGRRLLLGLPARVARRAGRGGQAVVPDLPPVPRVPAFSERYVLTHLAADLPCSVDHGIIGLMDPAHGPFVHQAWWWRKRDSIHEKEKRFEPIPEGFRMSAHAPSVEQRALQAHALAGMKPGDRLETTIDFVLPNRRYEVVRCGDAWFSTLTTVTPVTPDQCRIDVRAAWNLFLWATPLVLPVGRFFGKKFVRQDQRTMEQQAEGLKHNPSLMLIDDADRPAKWYFALKQARLEAQRTGEPLRHPSARARHLRWRS